MQRASSEQAASTTVYTDCKNVRSNTISNEAVPSRIHAQQHRADCLGQRQATIDSGTVNQRVLPHQLPLRFRCHTEKVLNFVPSPCRLKLKTRCILVVLIVIKNCI